MIICPNNLSMRENIMQWIIKGFYLALISFVVGSFIFLMYGDIPAPTTEIEHIIPNDRFIAKESFD